MRVRAVGVDRELLRQGSWMVAFEVGGGGDVLVGRDNEALIPLMDTPIVGSAAGF